MHTTLSSSAGLCPARPQLRPRTRPPSSVRDAEQRKIKNFSKYAARAHSVKPAEFAPFAISGVGSVGEEADLTLRALAVAAVPGPDKDPAMRLHRAMWLSARRKELMAVFVRNFHFVAAAKHRAVTRALMKERNAGELDPLAERHAIPEDAGVFGAVDEAGNELLDPGGRTGDVRLVAPTLLPTPTLLPVLPMGMPPTTVTTDAVQLKPAAASPQAVAEPGAA